MKDGRDLWWHDLVPQPGRDLRAGADGERGHALPALHLRHHRQAEGHPAHHRRLSDRRHQQRTAGSSTSRTTTSTGRPPTSAGSPATPTSSTARSPTAPPASSTRARRTGPTWDRWWEIIERYGVTILYTAPTAIRAHMKWGRNTPRSTISRRCACWARSASRSTPRPGSGTTSTSAAGAARSSTPGGRPRPARS